MIDSNSTHLIQEKIAEVLSAFPMVRIAYLYGSAASGLLRADSDIDVAIGCRLPMPSGMKEEIASKLDMVLHRPVDVLDLSTAYGVILRNALRGICVFCRDSSDRYRVSRRMVYDQEDMQPLRREMMRRRREALIHGS